MITSAANPKVKAATALRDRKHRDRSGLFLLEGCRELSLALQAGYRIESIFYREEALSAEATSTLMEAGQRGAVKTPVSADVFRKLAMRESGAELIAVCEQKRHRLEDLTLEADSLLLVIDRVEKPGNLGALLRTADGAGVDVVLLSDTAIDVFNPNVIRASLGAVFGTACVKGSQADLATFLKQNSITTIAATPDASKSYDELRVSGRTALLLGSEAYGIAPAWLEETQIHVSLPMRGRVDSLNLSVAGGILLYELARLRRLPS